MLKHLAFSRAYYDVIRFSQWEDCRQISVSIILMSHDLSQPIRVGSVDQTERERERDAHALLPEGSNSVGVGTLKMRLYLFLIFIRFEKN